MEFLYPRTEDGDRIILLLLVAKDQSIQAMCYDWEASESLRQTRPRVTVNTLAVDDRLPTILVPLTKATAFMVITTTAMIVYKNVLDAKTEWPRSRYAIPSQDPRLCRSPLWTRWARPFRNWMYNQTHDQIYLCREDGWLSYLEIDNMAEIESETGLGELGCNVDGAFDVLDIDFEGGDFLIAGGNMGDGALFIQKPRQRPKCVQKFLNWAPVLDSIIVDSSIRRSERTSGSGSDESVTNDRIFTCSGSAIGSGAITQHRYGIEAQIGLMFPLPEDLLSSRSIWALPRDANGGICLLVSDPISSTLLVVPPDAAEEVYATDSSEISLNFSAQTLAFGYTSEGIIAQVTDNSIHLTTLDSSFTSFAFRYADNQSIIATVINSHCGLVAVAVRTQSETHIHLGKILSASRTLRVATIGCPIEINYEPVCLLVEDFELSVFLFVGTSGGRLVVYRVGNDGLDLLAEYEIHLNEEGVSKAIDSMARVTTTNDDDNLKKSTLFCGLRSGTLVPFEILVKETDGVPSIGRAYVLSISVDDTTNLYKYYRTSAKPLT
jgi:Mono-functional DNA-alkylating methyl methanesulfonate N-term